MHRPGLRSSPGDLTAEHSVYKVVGAGLRSSIAVGRYDVRYLVGEFVSAPAGTKIFVFESLVPALDYQRRDFQFELWAATAIGLSSPADRITDGKHSTDIEDFWRVHNGGRSYGLFGGLRTPRGTLWADSIRLDACLRRGPGSRLKELDPSAS